MAKKKNNPYTNALIQQLIEMEKAGPREVGRPPKFTPTELWVKFIEYVQWAEDHPIKFQDNKGTKNVNTISRPRPITRDSFNAYLGTGINYLNQLPEEFSLVVSKIKAIIDSQLFDYAAVGVFKENLIARKLGLVDRSAQEQSGKLETQVFLVNGQEIKF